MPKNPKHTAAAWAAARVVGTASQQLVAALSRASTAQEASACVGAALSLFDGIINLEEASGVSSSPDSSSLRKEELAAQAQVVGWPALRALFYAEQFDTWACAVLAVAAGEWLPQLQGTDRDSLWALIAATFVQCPAWNALSALLGHLSAVTPQTNNTSGAASVTALAADSAAQLLVQRFLAPDSTSLQELLSACDTTSSRQDPHGSDSNHPQQKQQQQLSEERAQETAGLLAALPDRLQLLRSVMGQQLPSAPEVVVTLVHACIQHIAVGLTACQPLSSSSRAVASSCCRSEGQSTSSSQSSSCEAVGASAVTGAAQLTALLLQKLVTRGHGTAVAGALLSLAVEGLATANSSSSSSKQYLPALQQVLLLLLSQRSAAPAVEQLLRRVLSSAAANQQQPQQAAQAVVALFGPLLSNNPQLRSITVQKLVLGRTLPTAALQLLLQLLSACRPSLLPEAAAVLAQSWCDSRSILQLPAPQQAFMTAALVACLQQIPRALLDPSTAASQAAADAAAAAADSTATAAALRSTAERLGVSHDSSSISAYTGLPPEQSPLLLSSVIQGVSARLASPSPAIRLQAMRAGRAFAEKLDPSKPMFEDAGPLELMPEEVWPGAVPAAAARAAATAARTGQQQQQPPQQGVLGAAADSSATSSCSRGAGVAAGQESVSCAAMARLADATEGLDSDDEEEWSGPPPVTAAGSNSTHTPAKGAAPSATAEAAAGARLLNDAWEEGGSDAEGSEGSASSLVAFDLQEDLSAEQWWGPDGLGPVDSKGLGLRALAAALRKQDDVDGALAALRKVEVLVRAEPDELPVVAPELARSLIHCKVPIWATAPGSAGTAESPPAAAADAQAQAQTPKGAGSSAEIQRQRALVAVLSSSPLTSGDTVIAELYSPNLDQHQRVLILDGLAAAAAEMSDPRKAPQLALQGPQAAPELLLPAAAAGRAQHAALPSPQQQQQQQQHGTAGNGADASGAADSADGGKKSQAAPGLVQSSSRVWGKVSLQKQAAAAADPSSSAGRRTFRNRFAPVALRWTAALLQQCDVKQQGVDLFGRDSLLLGRLLTVLGSFVEAAAETPAAVPLCAGLLELLKAQEVSGHKEAFVRRSALVAAAQVVRNLPPARLAGAMVGRQSDAADQVLVERLQWLMSWAQQVAVSDVDQHCKMLAAGCVAWHVELAEGAMAALEHLPEPEGPSLAAVGGKKAARGTRQGTLDVRLPSVERLVLS